jgi:ubiquinone/menaquinone biosynthesis C-methylase UbiE
MSPQIADYPRYAWQLLAGSRSGGELALAEMRSRDLAPYLDSTRPLKILDVANGRLRPQYAILRSAGHQVVGVDLVNRPSRSAIDLAYAPARWMFAWKQRLALAAIAGRTLVCGDVGTLPFPDRTFDLAVSAAAFEHFLDVPSVVAELYRVLRPGGMVWISIHLFTSPTGGHNLSFTKFPLRRVPKGVDPWDHLRRRRLPFSVPLNEWRADQYLEAFARRFEIVSHNCWSHEGELLLTPAIEAELSAYTREDLTCAAYAIVARKEG